MMDSLNFAICICTYQRPHLVCRLIEDLLLQSYLPCCLIVIDGDSASGAVRRELETINFPNHVKQIYLPSNHANLAYQRYLGWRVARAQAVDFLLYLDDDLRIEQPDAMEKIIIPMLRESDVVAVTTRTEVSGELEQKFSGHPILIDRQRSGPKPILTRWFGASRTTPPGGLTPVGGRIPPTINKEGYGQVEWLSGRVMAYRMSVLDETVFSDDLFALTHIHCGMGEDTFLSHRVSRKGKMLLASQVVMLHPDDALPNSYPIQAKKLGYAIAFSRRLLNDYYRGNPPPHLSDRIALLKSYLGHILLSWYRVFLKIASYRHLTAYAWGYTLGAIRGMLHRPTASNLTPEINWRADAEAALVNLVTLQTM